ncbi:MAG: hypothetical protein HY906_23370 [Deltaproteobacteria bacterium]|nr:hypothetical protein [Deltaproteobacteria bacterium]
MRRTASGLLLAAVAVAIIAAPRPASARVLELYLQLDPVGGWTGWRAAGSRLPAGQGETDFFARNQGGLTGFKFGAEILFIDVFVDFKQGWGKQGQNTTVGWTGSWLGFYLGIDLDLRFGDEKKWHFLIGGDVGFGLGLAGPINPPIDNAEVSSKGFVAQGRLGLDYHITKVFGIGLEADVGYHYLFLNGVPVNNLDNQVHGIHFMGMLTTKLAFGI